MAAAIRVPKMRTFASDNAAPAASDILHALAAANDGDAVSYGSDPWTAQAERRFREIFGDGTEVYFAFNGTGANVVALSCLVRPHEAVIAPASAHLQTDECGAFERFTGSKILTVEKSDGKLRVDDLARFAHASKEEHHVQPRVVSISQSTEYGTLYSAQELEELCRYAHAQGWFVHVDGARIANASVALGMDLRACTRDLGVDVLTFGGTKNGLLFGEAMVFFRPELHGGLIKFARKQAMQLSSKMRFISAQFLALLSENRWQRYAAHANEMARRLEQGIREIPAIRITRPVTCNAIFATLDRGTIARLQERYFFYVFDEALPEVRWMTHHATTTQDVDAFIEAIRQEVCAPTA